MVDFCSTGTRLSVRWNKSSIAEWMRKNVPLVKIGTFHGRKWMEFSDGFLTCWWKRTETERNALTSQFDGRSWPIIHNVLVSLFMCLSKAHSFWSSVCSLCVCACADVWSALVCVYGAVWRFGKLACCKCQISNSLSIWLKAKLSGFCPCWPRLLVTQHM